MNRLRVAGAIAAMVLLLVLIAGLAGVFNTTVDSTLLPASTGTVAAERLFAVHYQPVEMSETVPGSLVARDETVIASRILSRIERVLVRAGDVVAAGDVLVELERADLDARVRQARDQAGSIGARVEDARLRLERAEELLARGLSPQADVDSARAAFESLGADLARATEMRAEVEAIRSYATITAPIAGRVIERLAEPGDTIAPGAPLLSIYDPLSMRAEAHVPESLAVRLAPGALVQIEVDALGHRVPGTIEEIVPAANPASRSFLTRAAIAFYPALRPGMFARFVVPVGVRDALLVPREFVREVGELDVVQVWSEGTRERRYVRLGREYPVGLVEVTSGLEAGESLLKPADQP